jgi:predicted enzyme related to lactoylglutathione lyase
MNAKVRCLEDTPDTRPSGMWLGLRATACASSSQATDLTAKAARLLEAVKQEGVEIDPKREDYDYGRFAWIMDPEGNRIELWEPPKGK